MAGAQTTSLLPVAAAMMPFSVTEKNALLAQILKSFLHQAQSLQLDGYEIAQMKKAIEFPLDTSGQIPSHQGSMDSALESTSVEEMVLFPDSHHR